MYGKGCTCHACRPLYSAARTHVAIHGPLCIPCAWAAGLAPVAPPGPRSALALCAARAMALALYSAARCWGAR